jgi:hypothetical protein
MNANSYYMYQILSQANRKGHNVISFVAHTKYDRRVAARYMRNSIKIKGGKKICQQ